MSVGPARTTSRTPLAWTGTKLAGYWSQLGSPGEHALISLLALNGLRVSQATGAGGEALGLERGHHHRSDTTLSVWTHAGDDHVACPSPMSLSPSVTAPNAEAESSCAGDASIWAPVPVVRHGLPYRTEQVFCCALSARVC